MENKGYDKMKNGGSKGRGRRAVESDMLKMAEKKRK